jgi:hypothetical protein
MVVSGVPVCSRSWLKRNGFLSPGADGQCELTTIDSHAFKKVECGGSSFCMRSIGDRSNTFTEFIR